MNDEFFVGTVKRLPPFSTRERQIVKKQKKTLNAKLFPPKEKTCRTAKTV
jgi:hypothetical protein